MAKVTISISLSKDCNTRQDILDFANKVFAEGVNNFISVDGAKMTCAPATQLLSTTAPAPAEQPLPATAPTYTLDDLARAGAGLRDQGKLDQLVGLLQKYNVDSLPQLQTEQYGAFATDLRGLGASI